MNKLLDFVLRVLAWALMLVGFIILVLMALGIVHSLEETMIIGLINAGIFLELGRIETRLDLLWSDFKKRKKL
jgi:hypothetical protein